MGRLRFELVSDGTHPHRYADTDLFGAGPVISESFREIIECAPTGEQLHPVVPVIVTSSIENPRPDLLYQMLGRNYTRITH